MEIEELCEKLDKLKSKSSYENGARYFLAHIRQEIRELRTELNAFQGQEGHGVTVVRKSLSTSGTLSGSGRHKNGNCGFETSLIVSSLASPRWFTTVRNFPKSLVERFGMKTILHIGQHKTGTTSLQHFLSDKRSQLAELGLYVPKSIVSIDNPSHYILNVFALDKDRSSPMKEQILTAKGEMFLESLGDLLREDVARHYGRARELGCSSVIWSNEGMYLLNSIDEYQRLYDLFSPHSSNIAAICCFRDVVSYRDSYKQQLSKQGITFINNPNSYRYVSEDSWLFDYKRKKELLNSIFDEVMTFDYVRKDNIQAFFSCIGVPVSTSTDYRMNVTAKNSATNSVKFLNCSPARLIKRLKKML